MTLEQIEQRLSALKEEHAQQDCDILNTEMKRDG